MTRVVTVRLCWPGWQDADPVEFEKVIQEEVERWGWVGGVDMMRDTSDEDCFWVRECTCVGGHSEGHGPQRFDA